MARRAALLNDRHGGRRIHRADDFRFRFLEKRESDRRAKRERNRHEQSLLFAILFVRDIQVMANRDASAHGQTENQPAEVVIVGHGEMVADHRERDGQREIIVVLRPPLGFFAVFSIQWFAGRQLLAHGNMMRNDTRPHIEPHTRTEHRPRVNVRGSSTEYVLKPVRRRRDESCHDDENRPVARKKVTNFVIEKPAGRDRRNADSNRRQRADIGDARIDQIRSRAVPIKQCQKNDPGNERRFGRPGMDEKSFGMFVRPILFVIIKTAAVDLVERPANVFFQDLVFGRAYRKIEPIEIERRANPGDARHQVQPPKQKSKPLLNQRDHFAVPRRRRLYIASGISGEGICRPLQRHVA